MNSQYPGQGPGGVAPAQDPLLGQTIGNYLVRQKLGEGGMGSVYLAEHPHIGKKVALKVLHAEFASNQDVVSRFFNEAKAVNDIGHPNIVDIVDYGVIQAGPLSGEGMVYFIMEFLGGTTLTDLERRDSPLAPERALSIALSVADALSASHKCGIVHRDLKPDNIMLVQRGREKDFVKLLDFGIAKLTGDQPGSRRTRTGIVMGTPAYMSPEQCEGRGNVDHRTDIYALGIVIYEMITGRVPFTGDGYGEILVQHLTQMPVPPSTIRGVIPPHVESIVMKALNKRPEDRYPTMDEFMKALADPVGYVETHGGLQGFQQTVLIPTNSPISTPGGVRLTPSPLSPLTPIPGSMTGLVSATTPTTLGASTGQVGGSGKKVGIIAGIGVMAAAGAVVAVLMSGSPQPPSQPAGEGSAAVVTPPVVEAKDPTPPPTPPTDPGAGNGSAAATPPVADPPGGTTTPPGGTTTPAGDPPAVAPPPTDDKITITIESTPAGAAVMLGTEKKPRGRTPLTFQVAKADKEVEIDLELAGYHDYEKKISLSKDQSLDAVLRRRSGTTPPPVRPPGGTTVRPPTAGDNTLNPFDTPPK